jgi:hypothetical protein
MNRIIITPQAPPDPDLKAMAKIITGMDTFSKPHDLTVGNFYHKYANVRLYDRLTPLNVPKWGFLCLSHIYKQVNEIEEKKRALEIEESKLLTIAEPYLNEMTMAKNK